eukprot:5118473-Prymnesium_polylepis.1
MTLPDGGSEACTGCASGGLRPPVPIRAGSSTATAHDRIQSQRSTLPPCTTPTVRTERWRHKAQRARPEGISPPTNNLTWLWRPSRVSASPPGCCRWLRRATPHTPASVLLGARSSVHARAASRRRFRHRLRPKTNLGRRGGFVPQKKRSRGSNGGRAHGLTRVHAEPSYEAADGHREQYQYDVRLECMRRDDQRLCGGGRHARRVMQAARCRSAPVRRGASRGTGGGMTQEHARASERPRACAGLELRGRAAHNRRQREDRVEGAGEHAVPLQQVTRDGDLRRALEARSQLQPADELRKGQRAGEAAGGQDANEQQRTLWAGRDQANGEQRRQDEANRAKREVVDEAYTSEHPREPRSVDVLLGPGGQRLPPAAGVSGRLARTRLRRAREEAQCHRSLESRR